MFADLATAAETSTAAALASLSPVQALHAGRVAGQELAHRMVQERLDGDRRRLAQALSDAAARVPQPRLG